MYIRMAMETATARVGGELERHCRCGAIATAMVSAEATHVASAPLRAMISSAETEREAIKAAQRKAMTQMRRSYCPACNELDPRELRLLLITSIGVAAIVASFFLFVVFALDAPWLGSLGVLATIGVSIARYWWITTVESRQIDFSSVRLSESGPRERLLVTHGHGLSADA